MRASTLTTFSTVTLIHGTFATNAAWTRSDSPLSKGLQAKCPHPIKFQTFGWSGKNTFRARVSAKYSLIEQLALSGDSASSDYYMAHSHGGNILAYALNQRPDLARKIGGCVFLSTPFYVYRLLPSWRYLLDGLLLPLSLLIAFAISQLMHLLIFGCAYLFAKWSGINVAWLYVPIITVTSFLCAIFVLARLNRWKRGVTWRLLARARYLRTSMSSGIPAGTNAIFIRSSGDEAAAALGFMQTVSWL